MASKIFQPRQAGDGLNLSGNSLNVNVDDSTIQINGSNQLELINNVKLIQTNYTLLNSLQTGSTPLPYDDSIPQNTEGTEFITCSITPININDKLRIDVVLYLGKDSDEGYCSAALFQDSIANALAAAGWYPRYPSLGAVPIIFTHWMTAGTTNETTFKVRGGINSSGNYTVNGDGGARRLGGVFTSSISIMEFSN
jgi:hypothetical protein